jgi:hypothetical protein
MMASAAYVSKAAANKENTQMIKQGWSDEDLASHGLSKKKQRKNAKGETEDYYEATDGLDRVASAAGGMLQQGIKNTAEAAGMDENTAAAISEMTPPVAIGAAVGYVANAASKKFAAVNVKNANGTYAMNDGGEATFNKEKGEFERPAMNQDDTPSLSADGSQKMEKVDGKNLKKSGWITEGASRAWDKAKDGVKKTSDSLLERMGAERLDKPDNTTNNSNGHETNDQHGNSVSEKPTNHNKSFSSDMSNYTANEKPTQRHIEILSCGLTTCCTYCLNWRYLKESTLG